VFVYGAQHGSFFPVTSLLVQVPEQMRANTEAAAVEERAQPPAAAP
jgi:hypothetical protein